MSWREFWNSDTTIYVNNRHRQVHYRTLASDIVGLLPENGPENGPDHGPDSGSSVLDFGCGEALCADAIAHSCGRLVLCDAADTVRKRLVQRFKSHPNVVVTSPEAAALAPEASFDVIIVNSVIQYFTQAELDRWLAIWLRMLKPAGRLVLGDVVPANVSPLIDAGALLKFAMQHGFLLAATTGLVRTYFSSYRKKRAELGFLRVDEREFIGRVERSGYSAKKHCKNLGHNSARLTLIASPIASHAPARPVAAPARLDGVAAHT